MAGGDLRGRVGRVGAVTVADLTDRYDERYRSAYAQGLPALNPVPPPRSLLSLVAAFVPRGAPVLEVGCGEGFTAVSLALLGYHVTALDASPTAIARARQLNNHPRVVYRVADVRGPLADLGGFACVVDIGCLHLLTDRRDRTQYLRTIWRLTRPGGSYYLRAGLSMTELGGAATGGHTDRDAAAVPFRVGAATAHVPAAPPIVDLDSAGYVAELRAAGFTVLRLDRELPGSVYPLEAAILCRRAAHPELS